MNSIIKAIILCGAVTQVSAISCYVCNYYTLTSDDSTLSSLLSYSTVGSSDCWGTPSSGLSQCASSSASCLTTRSDISMTIGYLGSSYSYSYRYVTKTCSSISSSDTCSSASADDIFSSAGLASTFQSLGMTYTVSGDASVCVCNSDGCNSGSLLRYSPVILILTVMVALKMI